MISISKVKVIPFRSAFAVRGKYEPVVKNGLAITPSDMVEMMNNGMSISAQAYSMLDKETISQRNDFEVPLEHRKGFDMVDGWTLKQDVLGRFRAARQAVKDGRLAKTDEFLQAAAE